MDMASGQREEQSKRQSKVQDAPGTPTVITGGDLSRAVFGTKVVNKNKTSVINNYDQGQAGDPLVTPEGSFPLSPKLVVYENNPINADSRIYRAKLRSEVLGDRDIIVKLLAFGAREQREARVHFSLPHHENIVEGLFSDSFLYRGQKTIFVAMECCDDQNLYNYVISQASEGENFDPEKYVNYAYQVAKGLEFLHSHNVINRDLKPSNLLLAKDKTIIKIADFGISKEISPGFASAEQTINCPCTPGWRAPEILKGADEIGFSSDIFALGLIFHFLWSYGNHPFGDDPHAWDLYIKRGQNLNVDNILIPNLNTGRDILNSMLKHEPDERPTAATIVNSDIFKNFQFI